MTVTNEFETQPASSAFEPAFRGTEDHRWNTALQDAVNLILPEAGILVVSPHPDDETLGAGGLIRSASNHRRPVTVLFVTDGESAYPGWKDLQTIRRREASRALAILAPRPVTIRRLGIPDGRVSQHRRALFDAIDRIVSPGTLLVAPFERDGHPDHDATGEVCIEVARRRELALWRYPIWTWHHNTPERLHPRTWGRFWLDENTRRAKRLAIDCFASQIRPEGRRPVVPPHVRPYFARPFETFLV